MYMLLALLALLSSPWQVVDEQAICTWYGNEFLGRRHAASWHQQTPQGFPEIVTEDAYGVAAPVDIPFGTILCMTRVETCNGEASKYDGRVVIVMVVDRKRNYHARGYYDLWPAAAKVLGFGPTFGDQDVGCIRARIEVLRSRATSPLAQPSLQRPLRR